MRSRTMRLVVLLSLVLGTLAIPGVTATPIANDAFQRTWARTDQPVAAGAISRTWMWGPEAFTDAIPEPYAQSPGQNRTVQYFDKSRMEITHPDAVDDGLWYVTNGLLVSEMVSGQVQIGDSQYGETIDPPAIPVAGDTDGQILPQIPSITYADIATFDLRNRPARAVGELIWGYITRAGHESMGDPYHGSGVTAAYYVPETNHTVASVFWDFMNSEGLIRQGDSSAVDKLFPNPFYATGFPITEAYWLTVKVAGAQKDVLWQCFERRCLTYTSSNPVGWQVEAGNVGLHYFDWRYAGAEPAPVGEHGVVTRVVDGDTFDVDLNGTVYRVRLIGIDTPEVYGGVDCYGPEASAATKQLIEGKVVRLVKDVSNTDRYDRLLRYVYVGDLFVNDWLVRNGYAYASTYPPDVAHSQQLAAAQNEAQAAGRGLWAGCNATPTQPPAQPTATPTQPAQPTATPTKPPSSACHPSYPNFCIPPPPPDLNCSDFSASQKPIRVLWNVPNPDPHRLDGNKDGWGCEG